MNPRPSRTGVIIVIPLLIVAALAVWTYATRTTNSEDKWPPAVKRVDYPSQADASLQPAMFYAPASAEAKPLLVALHTWNGGYDQADSIDYADWCMKQGWAFAWRGLLGAELIVTGLTGVGPILRLQGVSEGERIQVLLAAMLLVCIFSASVDRFVFENIEARLLKERGLSPHAEVA